MKPTLTQPQIDPDVIAMVLVVPILAIMLGVSLGLVWRVLTGS